MRVFSKKKMIDENEFKRAIIEVFPFIGPNTSIKILKHFKTLKNFFNCKKEDLNKIDGIGKKKIDRIYDIINFEYEEKKCRGRDSNS